MHVPGWRYKLKRKEQPADVEYEEQRSLAMARPGDHAHFLTA
jgi:hypothetical protein